MSIAVDASTPARWSGTPATPGGTIVSASFTAPADALLVVCINWDDNAGLDQTYTVTDSGGLTWTTRVTRGTTESTSGGGSSIRTARTTSSVSRTITVTSDAGTSGKRVSAKCYVLTGVDVDGTPVDTVGANNEGGSNTNNLTTTSITPGANGLLIVSDTDWNVLGVFTSSDLTIDTADYAGAISVVSGYKICTSGVGVTGNCNAGGTSAAQHKWCQVTVREAAGATPVTHPFSPFTIPPAILAM